MQAFAVITILLAPLSILFVPRRYLGIAFGAAVVIQVGAFWLAGCVTSMLDCPSTCAFLYPACEDPNDDNDAAPFGMFFVAIAAIAIDVGCMVIRAAMHWAWSKRNALCKRTAKNAA